MSTGTCSNSWASGMRGFIAKNTSKAGALCGMAAVSVLIGRVPYVLANMCFGKTGAHVQGVSAIRSLEMAAKPGMRGRDRKVCDNWEAVEVQFLSPRCQDDAHAPRLRLTINVVKRA